MKEKTIVTKIEVCTMDDLTNEEQVLVEAAKEATKGSYAPYSKFNVGAALLLDNGEMVTGANQENAAFPSGTCAERTTIFYAGAKYPGVKFRKLAIAAFTKGNFVADPISPCGACRQAILEYETLAGEPIDLLLFGSKCIYRIHGVAALLPLCFSEF